MLPPLLEPPVGSAEGSAEGVSEGVWVGSGLEADCGVSIVAEGSGAGP